MEITKQQVELRILKPSAGKYLTQSSADIAERTFSKTVYLSPGASEKDFREADEAEKLKYEADEAKKRQMLNQ